MTSPSALAGRLRCWIEAQHLLPGSRLPSERELAVLLGVTRFQARSVLRELERAGVVRAASPRIRVVTEAEVGSAPRSTVAVIAPLGTSPVPGQESAATLERRLMLGLDHAVRQAGLVQLTVPPDADSDHLERLLAMPLLGWIVVSAAGSAVERLLHPPAGVAVCVYEDLQPASVLASCTVDRVASGHAEGAAELVRWLQMRGRRNLLAVDEQVDPRRMAQAWRSERRAGLVAACNSCMCTLRGVVVIPEPALVPDDPAAIFATSMRIKAGFLAEHLLRPDPVDAILAVNDEATASLHAACRLLGRDPLAGDLDLVGFDNTWQVVPLFGPGERICMPATIDRDLEGVGRGLVELVVARAGGHAPSWPQRRVLSPRLVEVPQVIAAGDHQVASFNP